MINSAERIMRHLDRMLAERDEHGVTVAEKIAAKLIEGSLAGDHVATGLILRALDDYDARLASGDDEDQDQDQ